MRAGLLLPSTIYNLTNLSYGAELDDGSSLPDFIVFDEANKSFRITPPTTVN